MNTLPHARGELPSGLNHEKPGNNVASLVMTDAMKSLVATVIQQWKAPKIFRPLAKYGIYPVRQLFFYGPPGNGKTSACQWISQRLEVPLYRVRCEQLVAAYLGKTASNVGEIMEWLTGAPPAVILFDEIESLFPARGDGGGACAREMSAAMTVYWQYLDRWTGHHLFVAATNLPSKLDPALMSRFELHLEFGPPTEPQCREVISYWSEVLHDYGGAVWAAQLNDQLDGGHTFTSFRSLWQTIQSHVIADVSKTLGGAS